MLCVYQYSETWVRISLSLNRVESSAPQSLHARYFSTNQASNPAGESANP